MGESLTDLPTRQIIKEIGRCRKVVNGYVNHSSRKRDRRGKREAMKVARATIRLNMFEPELRRRHPEHSLVRRS